MSLLALALVIEGLVQFGTHHREVDEGWQAHLFQILMILQVPVVLLFAATANWKQPSRPLLVLGLQTAAWGAPSGHCMWLDSKRRANSRKGLQSVLLH
jgi:hypothetical protein